MAIDILVEIMAKRIMSGGLNPKTGNVYTINDITNAEYRQAVEAYIASHS